MNVIEAMAEVNEYQKARERDLPPGMRYREIVAITLAKEVELLRAEVEILAVEVTRLQAIEHERIETQTELAAAKAASVCPVNASWCYESNECDIVITGMSDEDSTKFGNWLRERMKERGEG